MANNPYVNRVDFGNETLIDISNTTAEPEDVIEGQVFYTKSGAPATGMLGDATTSTHGLMSASDKSKLDNIDLKKAPIIINNVSGNLVVINDGIPELKLYDAKTLFTPKQEGSGDPSPTNIRTINGQSGVTIYHTGKNIFHLNENEMISDGWNRYFPNPITKPGTYMFSCENQFGGEDTKGAAICFKNSPLNSAQQIGDMMINQYAFGRTIYSSTVTITEEQANAAYIAFYCNSSKASAESFLNANFQLEVGTIKTDYEPYIGESYSISWQTEAGIVYGGNLNISTGELTIERISYSIKLSEMTKSVKSDRNCYQKTDIPFSYKIVNKSSQISNLAKYQWNMPNEGAVPHFFAYTPTDQNTLSIYIALPLDSDDTQDFVMCAVLETPYIVQLTPIQINLYEKTNIFWSDNDNLEIAYPTDTKKYIDAYTKDVQIAETSIISNGVANIPYATTTTPGVVMTSGTVQLGNDHKLWVNNASDNGIKEGTSTTSYLTPSRQERAVFYGLTKAAGVDMASSNNAVGTYTDAAKTAIQKMIGVYPEYGPMEFITQYDITADTRDITVNTDQYGQPFKLAQAAITLVFGTGAPGINDYIASNCYDQDGLQRGMPTMRLISSSHTWLEYFFIQFGGLGLIFGKASSSGNTQAPQLATFHSGTYSNNNIAVPTINYLTGVRFKSHSDTTTAILAGSRIIIYGCRVLE